MHGCDRAVICNNLEVALPPSGEKRPSVYTPFQRHCQTLAE